MGWWVIGFGTIGFKNKISEFDLNELYVEMKHLVSFQDVKIFKDTSEIAFEMGGNKGLDYSELDKIKEDLIKKGYKFTISVGEYVESEENYYFDSDDDERK